MEVQILRAENKRLAAVIQDLEKRLADKGDECDMSDSYIDDLEARLGIVHDHDEEF